MPQIYEKGIEEVCNSAEATCIELFAPPRGVLHKLVIKQLDGTPDGFTADLFNRLDACSAESEMSEVGGVPDNQVLLDPDLHRICPQVSVTASSTISSQFGVNYAYQNADEQGIKRTPKSRVYLQITPAGAGSKTFQVAYAIEPIEH